MFRSWRLLLEMILYFRMVNWSRILLFFGIILCLTSCKRYEKTLALTSFSLNMVYDTSQDLIEDVRLDSNESLILKGRYLYPRAGVYSGLSLKINEDSSFIETYYSDVPSRKNISAKGKVIFCENDLIKLDYSKRMENIYYYKIGRFGDVIFLIPINKIDLFNAIFSVNKSVLKLSGDSLNIVEYRDKISALNEVCFIKEL